MKKKRQTVARQAAARGPLPELPKELLDQLVKGPMTPAEVQVRSDGIRGGQRVKQRSDSDRSAA
ncbi:hypothetical protein [Burkholderia ubonensis]|uniref:hypothetical protein n=1 Tax=Burkholderia ubonensis TaxID=101571 RepID=UPI0012F82130|nr:hypothetical protein [Burkholderia ubonensis]